MAKLPKQYGISIHQTQEALETYFKAKDEGLGSKNIDVAIIPMEKVVGLELRVCEGHI